MQVARFGNYPARVIQDAQPQPGLKVLGRRIGKCQAPAAVGAAGHKQGISLADLVQHMHHHGRSQSFAIVPSHDNTQGPGHSASGRDKAVQARRRCSIHIGATPQLQYAAVAQNRRRCLPAVLLTVGFEERDIRLTRQRLLERGMQVDDTATAVVALEGGDDRRCHGEFLSDLLRDELRDQGRICDASGGQTFRRLVLSKTLHARLPKDAVGLDISAAV